jgi:hypothetical protein
MKAAVDPRSSAPPAELGPLHESEFYVRYTRTDGEQRGWVGSRRQRRSRYPTFSGWPNVAFPERSQRQLWRINAGSVGEIGDPIFDRVVEPPELGVVFRCALTQYGYTPLGALRPAVEHEGNDCPRVRSRGSRFWHGPTIESASAATGSDLGWLPTDAMICRSTSGSAVRARRCPVRTAALADGNRSKRHYHRTIGGSGRPASDRSLEAPAAGRQCPAATATRAPRRRR